MLLLAALPFLLVATASTSYCRGFSPHSVAPTKNQEWFVSSQGTPRGRGSNSEPWDLATALANGPTRGEVKPGDTIWLRGGRYTGTFLSTLSGTEHQPIIVRAMPGERVIIDKGSVNGEKQPALKVKGSWVWFWGIEIMNSAPNRPRRSPYTGRDEPWRGSGADVYAPHVKFINMIFHDNGHGIWDKQDMTEIYGCLFFYNGTNKREHAMYVGNASGTKHITDNIVFSQGGYGILAHSDSTSSSQRGLNIEGNVTFNNGAITGDDQNTGNLQVGGVNGVPAERIVIRNNYVYNTPANAPTKNYGIRLGYEDQSNVDVAVLDNYIVSRSPLRLWWWRNVNFAGNTIYSTGGTVLDLKTSGVGWSGYHWDNNKYYGPSVAFAGDVQARGLGAWQQKSGFDAHSRAVSSTRPRGIQTFVRPNRFETGRGHIVVFNWDLKERVAVNLETILKPGAAFEIRDAQNYFGEPLVSGIYRGGTISLPMNSTTVTAPIGNVERMPVHTSLEFGVFVVITRSHQMNTTIRRLRGLNRLLYEQRLD